MKALLLLAAFVTVSAQAALDIKPGLWEISTNMKVGEKMEDPTAKMKALIAKMPADQRKRMEAIMGKSGAAFGDNGAMRVCYTSEMLKNNEAFKERGQSKCSTKIVEQTSKLVRTEFSCQDGSKGTGEWKSVSDTEYQGKMDFTTSKGQKSLITHQAKFISSDCGSVKPFGSR